MSETLELKIQKLLVEHGNKEQVADALLKEWDKGIFNKKDATVIAFFLLNSGLAPSLLDRINRQLTLSSPVLWKTYLLLLSKAPQHISNKSAEALRDALREDKINSFYFIHQSLQEIFPEIKEFAVEKEEKLEKKFADDQQELVDQILFLSTQRLIEEEKKAIEMLANMNPRSSELVRLREDFEDRWARHVIALKQGIEHTRRLSQKPKEKWTNEMEDDFRPLLLSIKDTLKESPEEALNLSLIAFFMDFTREAQDLMEGNKNSPSDDWYYAELLLENRRFVDLLEWINKLEVKYVDDPETTFACTYLRARSYWGLGEPATAIDLLTSILQIRPNYRAGHSLLQEWQGAAS